MERMTMASIDMVVPEKEQLAIIVQNELSTDFDETTVEWVDCPDLTQEPFYLAEPGICGDTALLDIGGTSNLFPTPNREKIFYFRNILQELNRTQSDNFIIGGGLCIRQSDGHLGELIMNTSFSSGDLMTRRNRSCFAYLYNLGSRKRRNDALMWESVHNPNPNCNIYGNFFVSNGLREQVLKIQAKKRFGRDFNDALQNAIRRFPKTDSDIIGFGGVFLVRNGATLHYVIRNDWDGPITKRDKIKDECFTRYVVNTPIREYATFVSANRHIVIINSEFHEIYFTRSNIHGYSSDGAGHYDKTFINENTEYLGYFSPATKIHRIDPVPTFTQMPDFSYL